MTTVYEIKRKDGSGEARRVALADLMATCAAMSADGLHPLDIVEAPKNSTFGGEFVTDDAAKARIMAQQSALRAAGVAVDETQQRYATGVRMADVGYATQGARKAEHDAKQPIADAMAELAEVVRSEERKDVEVSAAEFARNLTVNGKVSAFGLAVSEQAIRGLSTRLESPCLSYVLGIRARIAAEVAKGDHADTSAIHADKAQLAEILQHECKRAGDVTLKLRTRKAAGTSSRSSLRRTRPPMPRSFSEGSAVVSRAMPVARGPTILALHRGSYARPSGRLRRPMRKPLGRLSRVTCPSSRRTTETVGFPGAAG